MQQGGEIGAAGGGVELAGAREALLKGVEGQGRGDQRDEDERDEIAGVVGQAPEPVAAKKQDEEVEEREGARAPPAAHAAKEERKGG